MHPVLLRLEWGERELSVPAYGTAMALAMLTIVAVGWITAWRRGLPPAASLGIITVMAAAIPLAARISFGLIHDGFNLAMLDSLASTPMLGFFLPGGLVTGLAIGALLGWWQELDIWRLGDALAPALGLGCAVMRAGCYLNGCCFGVETSLPWGVVFPLGSPAHYHQTAEDFERLFTGPRPVHPTQLYELAAGLLVTLLALELTRRRAPAGVPILAAAAWFILFRWANDFWRVVNPNPSWPASVSAMFYVGFLAMVGALMACRFHAQDAATGARAM